MNPKPTPPQRVTFTVYNPATGEILRSGYCSSTCVAKQAKEGEAVLVGAQGHDIEDRVIIPASGAKPYLRKRSAADIATRRPAPAVSVDPMEVLVEALRGQGINVSSADLTAAAGRLQAQRTAAAKG